jgi:hypothetical protein
MTKSMPSEQQDDDTLSSASPAGACDNLLGSSNASSVDSPDVVDTPPTKVRRQNMIVSVLKTLVPSDSGM